MIHTRVADDETRIKDADGEGLRVRASHSKPEWEVGRMIRIGDDFYRVENVSERHGAASRTHAQGNDGLAHTHATSATGTSASQTLPDTHPRPYVYKLRRLAAGVATRHTLHHELAPDAAAALESWSDRLHEPAPAVTRK
jgi:hypothetical protein